MLNLLTLDILAGSLRWGQPPPTNHVVLLKLHCILCPLSLCWVPHQPLKLLQMKMCHDDMDGPLGTTYYVVSSTHSFSTFLIFMSWY